MGRPPLRRFHPNQCRADSGQITVMLAPKALNGFVIENAHQHGIGALDGAVGSGD